MENTVKQRLMEFCKATGIRPSHIEQKCGFSHGYINSLKDRPSTERAERILAAYPQLSRVWLLSGEGAMLNDGATVIGDNNITANNVNGNNEQNGGKVIDVLAAQLDEKDKQINKLLNIIENLSK